MADLMKMAGKTDNGQAKPLAMTNDGFAKINRVWASVVEELYAETEVRNTSYKVIKSTTVKDYGLISMRILNLLDSNITLMFLGEYKGDSSNRYIMRDANSNNYKEITIGQGYTIITADEFPFLNYLETLYFQVKANSEPTTGTLQIWGVYKG